MKKQGLLLTCVLSFCAFNAAAMQESGERERIAETYEQVALSLTPTSKKSPAAWYAFGCDAYKKGNYACAYALWQRARALGGSADICRRCEHNECCAQQKLGLTHLERHWYQSLDAWLSRVALVYLQGLFLVVWFIGLFFVHRRQYVKKTSKIFVGVFLLSVLTFGGVLIYRYVQDGRVYAVVVHEEQVLYAGPGSDYPIRGHGACGQTLVICDRRGEWYKVSTADGIVGWITRSSLMMVRP